MRTLKGIAAGLIMAVVMGIIIVRQKMTRSY